MVLHSARSPFIPLFSKDDEGDLSQSYQSHPTRKQTSPLTNDAAYLAVSSATNTPYLVRSSGVSCPVNTFVGERVTYQCSAPPCNNVIRRRSLSFTRTLTIIYNRKEKEGENEMLLSTAQLPRRSLPRSHRKRIKIE